MSAACQPLALSPHHTALWGLYPHFQARTVLMQVERGTQGAGRTVSPWAGPVLFVAHDHRGHVLLKW